MLQNQKGLTLSELLVACLIMGVTLTGMIQLFILTSVRSEMAGNKTLAVSEAVNKMEEIRNSTYADIAATYDNVSEQTTLLEGVLLIEVDDSNTDLTQVDIYVSWMDKYDRFVGEDVNMNGVLDSGEDLDGENDYDAPVKISSLITSR